MRPASAADVGGFGLEMNNEISALAAEIKRDIAHHASRTTRMFVMAMLANDVLLFAVFFAAFRLAG